MEGSLPLGISDPSLLSHVAFLVGPVLRGCVQRRQCCLVLVVNWWRGRCLAVAKAYVKNWL